MSIKSNYRDTDMLENDSLDDDDALVITNQMHESRQMLSRAFDLFHVSFLRIKHRIHEFEFEFPLSPLHAYDNLLRLSTEIDKFRDRFDKFIVAGETFMTRFDNEINDNDQVELQQPVDEDFAYGLSPDPISSSSYDPDTTSVASDTTYVQDDSTDEDM